ncbi:hypothetical protein BFI45_22135 (plasmid) [Yersinia pestis subsp. microtus bv. Altaica]|uniref:Uncharacterized protein n=1 Tax=Yersinia pseudotuberculosis TaxID=633 RepID=A0ABN5R0K7_YERPU|nr:hypothetical protein EGX42_00805 [Yersinia pestis]AYW89947.1 hypothetical protein EGX47_00455 [Yersinia pseudotuberculosis]OSZ83191.1 hypothetical protein A7722_21935 [Yersinia pestis subsp. microtus bv. Caucasica]OVY52531.1 hypothetical protein BFI45_22135 [Yersinia pestis subsp. microtus bv. Altaica]OVY69559.1 hypothetical protein BFI50_21075 [Yersinia pestis subsp. microtus bv. Xilingolensis]OVY76643.1 hypothetical protein BFI52_22060 [Yersinia pestis subsp. microtus]QFR87624.1 hypothet
MPVSVVGVKISKTGNYTILFTVSTKPINGYRTFFFYRIKPVNEMMKDDDHPPLSSLWVHKKE